MSNPNIILGGFDHQSSIQKGCYGVYNHQTNIDILTKNEGENIILRLYDMKDKTTRFSIFIKKYTFREIEDSELSFLIKKYEWKPVNKTFSRKWHLLIEFDYKDVVFPEKMKKQSNKITNYFQKQ